MIHSTIRWLRSRERRWPIPMRGLLLFGLLLAVVAGWMVWRTIDDNRMYRRFLNAELSASKRGSDHIEVSIDCHWLPRPIRGWLDRRNLVLFPRSDDHVLVSDEFDLEVVRWVVSLPGCQDVTLIGKACVECLRVVSGSPGIEAIELIEESEFSVTDLQPLSRFSNLRYLKLEGVDVGRYGKGVLGKLNSLEELHLVYASLSTEVVEELKLLPTLRKLHIEELGPSIDVIRKLSEIQLDVEVWMMIQAPDDATLAAIASVPDLTYLVIHRGDATDAGLAHLWRHPGLEFLKIHGTKGISDASCATLASLPRLATLIMKDTPITAAGLETLGTAQNLRHLEVRGTAISRDAAKEFRLRFPNVVVEWWVF